jgi:VWFA-related protein
VRQPTIVRLLSVVANIFILLLPLVGQQVPTVLPSDTGDIRLEVVVTSRSGPPVSGLEPNDFTVLDNKAQQTITSFRALRGRESPVEVLLVVDDVNTGFSHIAFERSEINKFLNIDSGNLAYPTALAVLTDSGTKIQDDFTTDGKALSSALDQYMVGLHTIPRGGGNYAAEERFQLSLVALHQIALREITRAGRKIVLWISPGWPLLGGPSAELSSNQQQQIFTDIVALSTLLREARITLYSIDPLGTQDMSYRTFNWQAYLKPVSKPNQAEWGDIALQVLAVHSGGLALATNNDLAAMLRQCLGDLQAYYELSFTPVIDQKKNAYHSIEVRVTQSGMSARTRLGYYSQVTNSGAH